MSDPDLETRFLLFVQSVEGRLAHGDERLDSHGKRTHNLNRKVRRLAAAQAVAEARRNKWERAVVVLLTALLTSALWIAASIVVAVLRAKLHF
jgi:ribosomal protein L4